MPCPPPTWSWDSTLIAGVVQAMGSLIPGIAVAVAAWVGLGSWRKHVIGERRVERAEDCLILADAFVEPILELRVGILMVDTTGFEEGADGFRGAVDVAEDRLITDAAEALERFRRAYRRAGFFIPMPSPSTFEIFRQTLLEIVHAKRMLLFWERGGNDPQSRAEKTSARQTIRGVRMSLPDGTEVPDPITVRLREATDALEDLLIPHTGGRRFPVSLR